MDLHGRALLILLSILSAFGGNVTEDGSMDKIGKTLTVFNVVKFPNDPCMATTGYNGTCYTAAECKTLGGAATGSCASSFGVCCVFSLSCGQTSSQNNTYIDQATYTIGTDPSLCTYKICSSGTVSKIKLEFNTFVISAPAGDAAIAGVVEGSPFYTGHCLEDTMNIVSPGHASPPEICGYNSGQHMFIPMSDQCVTINLNIGTTGSVARSWSMKIIQYQAGNQMAPDGNCLQYHTASSGTFASFAWNFDTYGPGITGTAGIAPYTQFHLANQHYNICFRREQGKTAICYTTQIMGIGPAGTASGTIGASSAASYGLGGSSTGGGPVGSVQQTDGTYMAASGPTASSGNSACQGNTVFATIGAAATNARTTGDYLEIPQAYGWKSAGVPAGTSTSLINRVCGNVFAAEASPDPLSAVPKTICSKTTPFRIGVHMDGTENMGVAAGPTATISTTGVASTFSDAFDNYYNSKTLTPNGGWGKNEGHGYSGFYLQYYQA